MRLMTRYRSAGWLGLTLFFCVSWFVPVSSSDEISEGWHLNKESAGIKVYGRPKPGSEREDIRSVMTLDMPMSRLESLLEDVENSHRWMHLLEEVKVFTESASGETFYYFHWDVPWPFDDRDAVCARQEVREAESGRLSFKYTPAPDAYPAKKKRVRLRTFECLWQLEPAGEGKVKVINQLTFPGQGALPSSFVNWINTKISLKTMQSLRAYVMKQKT